MARLVYAIAGGPAHGSPSWTGLPRYRLAASPAAQDIEKFMDHTPKLSILPSSGMLLEAPELYSITRFSRWYDAGDLEVLDNRRIASK